MAGPAVENLPDKKGGALSSLWASARRRETQRGVVLAALMLSVFMAAIEATIVATALPTIAGDLGHFDRLSWVFSIFLLTQAASIPIYGRLADIYGRKPVLLVGIVIFLAGSMLCGLAPSMLWLIIFRAFQGLGAGVVIPITATVIGDLFALAERARAQAWLSGVWGVSSVIGPTAGGFIVDNLGWPWIFYINLPLGMLALGTLFFFFHEKVEKRPHKLDFAGSFLMMAGTSSFLVFLLEGGNSWEWMSAPSLTLIGLALVLIGYFLFHEQRIPEPLLPLSLFRNRMFATVGLATLGAGVLTIGVSAYIPSFVQGVGGESATIAGLSLGAMSIGWSATSVVAGQLLMSRGLRFTALLGAPLLIISSVWLSTFDQGTNPPEVAAATFVLGMAMGFTTTAFIVMIQEAFPWAQRGVAVGANMFLRQMGAAVGIAVLGALINRQVKAIDVGGGRVIQPEELLNEDSRAALTPDVIARLSESFTDGFHLAFLALVVASALTVVTLFLLPKVELEKKTPEPLAVGHAEGPAP